MSKEKKEKLAQFHKNNILETAEKLFCTKGVTETTMDDIAKAADYSKSTLYVYFNSKENLYNHIIYRHMCHLHQTINDCIKAYTGFEQCYFQLCDTLVTAYTQYPFYFESMMGNICIDEEELAQNEILQKIYEIGEATNDCMLALVERGVAEQYLKETFSVLPAIHTLWISLANIIPVAHRKEQYFIKRMGLTKHQFMQYSFELLLSSMKRG